MSVIYEVNLRIDPERAADFGAWLPDHVQEVVELPGFVSAEIAREETDDQDAPAWSVRYRLVDREALERYLDKDAERMRADGLKRFGDRMQASRRILESTHRLPQS